ncbi:hypothetical protein, partial [[Kitasatospora] papulosa]|uniref:hypothetical protein n=1 Tax=[Kitasatospora] papulosa TaxID=1464011 RepID=UPI0036B9CB04
TRGVVTHSPPVGDPAPGAADTPHAALYEVPRLLCLYVREAAGPEETGVREPALSFGGGAPRLLSRG